MIVLLLAASALLFGEGKKETQKEEAKEAPGATEIRWTAWGNVWRIDNLYKVIIARFEEAHPDIKIKFEPYPATEKILAMFAAGRAPDIILCDWVGAQTWGGAGRALPLDPLIKEDNFDTSNIQDLQLASYRTDGVLYAMPFKNDVHALWYNKKLFDEAGLKYPDETWNWDAVRTNAKKLTDSSKKQYGFSWYSSGFDAYCAWPWMNNGSMVIKDAAGKMKYTFDDPNTVEAFQFLYDLIWKDKVMVSPSAATSTAMGMGGEQLFMSIKAFDWDMAPLPHQKTRATEIGGIANVISSGSKHPREAWEFLKFIVTPAAQDTLLETYEGLPVYKNAPAPTLEGKNTAALTYAVPYQMFEPHFPEWVQVQDEIVTPALDLLWNGKKQAQETGDEITRKANAFLAKIGR